jgi:gamma-glutamyl-gamma-aminobutyrate hydrolase PuuD
MGVVMPKSVRILYVNEMGPNDADLKLLQQLPDVKSVVAADYKYRVGDHSENLAYLEKLRRDWDNPLCFKPKKYNVTADDLCQFVDRSLDEQVHHYLSKVDCIYIAGSRFDPSSRYCTEQPTRVNPDIRREQFEMRLMKLAMERGIPTLVVCAGMWRIASTFGARAMALPETDIRSYHEQWKPVGQPDKRTLLVPGTALHALHLKAQNIKPWKSSVNIFDWLGFFFTRLLVNSTHWLAVPRPEDEVGTEYNRRFITSAKDIEHGNVEAIEAKHNAQFWGVQWHPELVKSDSLHYETHREILENLLVKGGLFFRRKQAVCEEIKLKKKLPVLRANL